MLVGEFWEQAKCRRTAVEIATLIDKRAGGGVYVAPAIVAVTRFVVH